MKAFHGKKEIKDKYIARVKSHAAATEIVIAKKKLSPFTHWASVHDSAVSCTIHSIAYRCQKYETELGIPKELAKLKDLIFKGMSNKEAKEFPLKFLEAIEVGADLSNAWYKFTLWLLKEIKQLARGYITDSDGFIPLYEKLAQGGTLNKKELKRLSPRDHIATVESAYRAAYNIYYITTFEELAINGYASIFSVYHAIYTASAADYHYTHPHTDTYTNADALAAYATVASAGPFVCTAHAAYGAAEQSSYDKQAEKLLEILREQKPKRGLFSHINDIITKEEKKKCQQITI